MVQGAKKAAGAATGYAFATMRSYFTTESTPEPTPEPSVPMRELPTVEPNFVLIDYVEPSAPRRRPRITKPDVVAQPETRKAMSIASVAAPSRGGAHATGGGYSGAGFSLPDNEPGVPWLLILGALFALRTLKI